MLFMAPDASKLERLQGTWLSDDEINKIVRYWKGIKTLDTPGTAAWDNVELNAAESTGSAQPVSGKGVTQPSLPQASSQGSSLAAPFTPTGTEKYDQMPLLDQVKQIKIEDGRDPMFEDAVRVVREAGRGSISLIQRELRVGYGRAARIVEQLEERAFWGLIRAVRKDAGCSTMANRVSDGKPPSSAVAAAARMMPQAAGLVLNFEVDT
jgi:S-DNA-T family DNA segregation ATPase FtsK/SpoIIIE